MKSTILLLLALAGIVPAGGETLALRDVERRVLTDNPTIQASRARWEAAKQRVPQEHAWDDPMAGVDFERMGTTRPGTYTDAEWMLSQSIPLTGKNLSRGRAAAAGAQAAFETLRRAELDAVNRARTAFYRLANGHAQLEINRRNRQLLRQFAEISRVKYEAGLATQGDLLLAQTEEVRLEETEANIRRDISDQQSQFNVLLNRPAGDPVGTPPELAFREPSLPRGRIEQEALAQRPEIAGAERQIDAGNARLQFARRAWIPDPQLRVEARHYKGAGGGFQEYDTGIFFSIPWVNFSKYSAAVREMRSDVEGARSEHEAARTEALGMVRDQLRKIDTFAHNYALFRDKIVPLAQKTVEVSRAGYESDKSGFLELITARRVLQDAESAMTEHLTNHEIAVAELDAVIGRTPEGATIETRKQPGKAR
jgi:outer membrane protein, heavy metal efflux system